MKFVQQCLISVFIFCTSQVMAGEKIDKALPSVEVDNVIIENLSGITTIIGWNDASVTVTGELDDSTEDFIFEKQGATIKIKVVMPKNYNQGWNNKGSELTINMPKALQMKFNGVSSDVVVKQLSTNSEVKTVSGNIEASNLSGYIELSTVSGNVNSNNLSGNVQLSSISGNINDKNSAGRLVLKAVSGEIETESSANEIFVNNVSGDIDLQLNKIDKLEISTVSGDIQSQLLLNETGIIKLSSVSGDMDMRFKKEVQASFKLYASAGGDLTNTLTKDKAKQAKYGPSSSLVFHTGNAKAVLKASTVSGNIKLLY